MNSKSFKPLLIELRPSKIHKEGVGVFAAKQLALNQRVAEGLGVDDFKSIFPWKKASRLSKELRRKIRDFCVGTPDGFVPPESLDFNDLSTEWYFNHSCVGNLGFDQSGDFIAIRNISKDEELCYDYGLVESNPKFKIKCSCGARSCRRLITGNDWKTLPTTWMHPFLRIQRNNI